MGALPRPDVPPGAHRDLVDALHDLHHRAGWPSLRTLAREAGCSHTTVSAVFSSPRLPSWGTLELLVEAMDGDTHHFHDLWLAASSPTDTRSPTIARIAGRRTELTAVRRHLETGTGLLLVTGEAGMGKTGLVATAAAVGSDGFVATGMCLPLASEVPLLPVADVLRTVHQSDGGHWLDKALSQCAPYVAGSLSLLVPELAEWETPVPGDDWARQRLFAAVETVVQQLSEERGLALLIEDLHWADTATLDLLEHLVNRDPAVPIVGTWRLDDPTVERPNAEWFNRVRRIPAVTTLTLTPLSHDETRDQLTLLTGQVPGAAFVDSIHQRTQGHPLFTEQLSAHGDTDRPLPSLLADLLDARLGDLTGPAWSAARALGVADRPLGDHLLAGITGLAAAELAAGLHDLDARRLLAPPARSETALRHPLLAEAIRRRLTPGETRAEHAAVARALGSSTAPEPAEVALHWQAAAEPFEELVWRIRAAMAAHERFALRQEAAQWVRALDLWPDDAAEAGRPPVRRVDALVSALDLYFGGIDPERASALAEEALTLVPGLQPPDAAEVLLQVGFLHADSGEPERGLDFLQRAAGIFAELPPCDGHVRALYALELTLRDVGRHQDAAAAVARGLAVSAELEDHRWYRTMLMQQAWYDARAGDPATALSRAREAFEVEVPGPDPRGEARLAADQTDLLLETAADVEDVVAAGTRGLDAAEAWGLDMFTVRVARMNVAQALWRAGQVRRAAGFIEPHTQGPPLEDGWVLHAERARLDMMQGRLESARELTHELRTVPTSWFSSRIELAECLAGVAVWIGEPETALEVAVPVVTAAAPTEAAVGLGPLLAHAARAAADTAVGTEWLGRLTALHESCVVDPFAIRAVPADSRAWAATWRAELARLDGSATVPQWVVAATEWDRIHRPHDAAYCRWRAAQVATATGQTTAATKLLRRAARDAREHVPLLAAIRDSAAPRTGSALVNRR
ncbi:helix-turn-helix transcriptional regulator [Nocardioides koreensis]|uniref:Helix-turn-helix transcriptional regulator n=1 Tax=Nocardioides koreensis TaxID=433651 RepID=A0ABN2ZHN1_9ACTN